MKLFLKNLLFTAVAPGTTAILVPLLIARRGGSETSTAAALASLPLFAAGVCVYIWTVFNFARIGRGTPAPIDPPRTLIVAGPHRWVRNPMYLAVLSVVAAWAVLRASLPVLVYGVLLGLLFHLFVVFVEEPSLARQFGSEYGQYRASVRRWIPRRPR